VGGLKERGVGNSGSCELHTFQVRVTLGPDGGEKSETSPGKSVSWAISGGKGDGAKNQNPGGEANRKKDPL